MVEEQYISKSKRRLEMLMNFVQETMTVKSVSSRRLTFKSSFRNTYDFPFSGWVESFLSLVGVLLPL